MRILVIGSGAVGSITAGMLSKRGFKVDLACKTAETANRINKDGLIFKIKKRKFKQSVVAFPGVSDTPGNYNYIILATKTFDIVEPTQSALDKLSSQGLLVSFQDGYCEERLSRIAGSDRVVGAVVAWGATLGNDGIAVMSSKGEMIIGKLDGSDDPRLDNLQYLLNALSPTMVVGNINEHIFSKLIINSCVTTVGAISGLKVGALITDRSMRNLFIKVIQEDITIANALKFEVPEYAGKLNYYRFMRGDTRFHRIRKHIFIRIFGFRYRNVKSSGLQSLERGEKTEVDSLNGYFIQKGDEFGINLPVNKRLLEMVHEIEDGKREISPSNLNNKLFGL
jgi:2-dehydropantoate 2-reductase